MTSRPLYQAGIDGTGQKLVVVGQTAINLSDIQTFRTKFGLSAPNIQQILAQRPSPGSANTTSRKRIWIFEWSGAVARNATIIYVYSGDVFTSLTYAMDKNLAPVVTMSYGLCEQSNLVDLPTFQSLAQQGNAEGITWLSAAGDSGAADCEDSGAAVAEDGLAVDAPGSVPEVTSMGGTEFNELSGTYWNTTNTANGASALSYIPEKVWNDTVFDGELSAGGAGPASSFQNPLGRLGPACPTTVPATCRTYRSVRRPIMTVTSFIPVAAPLSMEGHPSRREPWPGLWRC